MAQLRKVAIIKEAGSLNYISSIISSDVATRKDQDYFELTEPVANKILKAMDLGNSASFPKTLKGKLKVSDLIFEKLGALEKRKNTEISKYMRMITGLFTNMNFMALYDFMMINNKFCSIGVFIHKGNREEQYLKIINTGDEDMINSLEIFLERMDELNNINKRYKKITDALHNINDATSDEELDTVIDSLPQV